MDMHDGTTRTQQDDNANTYTPPMDVGVRIHTIKPEGSLRARLSLSLGGVFAIRGVRLMDGKNGYFLSMPGYKDGSQYRDTCFSFDEKFTRYMTSCAVQEYEQTLEQTHLASQTRTGQPEQAEPETPAPQDMPNLDEGQQMSAM